MSLTKITLRASPDLRQMDPKNNPRVSPEVQQRRAGGRRHRCGRDDEDPAFVERSGTFDALQISLFSWRLSLELWTSRAKPRFLGRMYQYYLGWSENPVPGFFVICLFRTCAFLVTNAFCWPHMPKRYPACFHKRSGGAMRVSGSWRRGLARRADRCGS